MDDRQIAIHAQARCDRQHGAELPESPGRAAVTPATRAVLEEIAFDRFAPVDGHDSSEQPAREG
jgi:hypothetical protein